MARENIRRPGGKPADGAMKRTLVIMANYARNRSSQGDSVWPSGRPRRGTWTADTTRDVTRGTPAQCRPPSPAPGLAPWVQGLTEGLSGFGARAPSGYHARERSERAAVIPPAVRRHHGCWASRCGWASGRLAGAQTTRTVSPRWSWFGTEDVGGGTNEQSAALERPEGSGVR